MSPCRFSCCHGTAGTDLGPRVCGDSPAPAVGSGGLPSQTGANPASAVAATPRGPRQERAARAPAASRRNVPCLQPTSVTPRETLQRRVTVHCLLTDAVGFLADDATCNRFSREIQTGLLPGRPAGQFWPLSPGSGSSPVGGRGKPFPPNQQQAGGTRRRGEVSSFLNSDAGRFWNPGTLSSQRPSEACGGAVSPSRSAAGVEASTWAVRPQF